MRRLHSAVRAIVFAAALVGWCALLAPPQRKPSALIVPALRLENSQVEQQPHRADTGQRETLRHASDVVVEDYPLRDADLAVLHRGDRIALPHPDGGTIDLVVERVDVFSDRRHLALTHDGLPSTFTEARGAFFGTVATRAGVYALEGNEQRSQLTRHTLLDQRTNPNALDYRPSPSL
jgi:hypothetical protein